jgi:hypothetical protein
MRWRTAPGSNGKLLQTLAHAVECDELLAEQD